MASNPDTDRTITIHVADEPALARLAAVVFAALPPCAFVALHGDLGAGKTTFVKAVAAAAGIDPADVVSPTFGLIHIHEGPLLRLVHADFYRLSSSEDLHETGWDDAVAEPPLGRRHVFVEWPARIANRLPDERLDIAIAIDSETGRTFSFTGRGSAFEQLIRSLAARSPA